METTGIRNEELEKLREDVQDEISQLSHCLFRFSSYVPYLLDSSVLQDAYQDSLEYFQDAILALSYALERKQLGIDPFVLNCFYRYVCKKSDGDTIT